MPADEECRKSNWQFQVCNNTFWSKTVVQPNNVISSYKPKYMMIYNLKFDSNSDLEETIKSEGAIGFTLHNCFCFCFVFVFVFKSFLHRTNLKLVFLLKHFSIYIFFFTLVPVTWNMWNDLSQFWEKQTNKQTYRPSFTVFESTAVKTIPFCQNPKIIWGNGFMDVKFFKIMLYFALTAHNWQKWKRVFLACPCHKIYRDEAVGVKSCKYTSKLTIFMKMSNLGQYRENLIFCQ